MKRWLRRAGAMSMASGLLLPMGCGNFWVYPGSLTGSGSSASGDVVYVANAAVETVAAFTVGSGTLTAVTGSPYSLGAVPTAAVVTPADTFLYVGTTGVIYGYSIGTGGVLTALNNGSGVAIADVAAMVVSPDGGWLLALDGNGLTIDEYQINTTTGALSPGAGASYAISGATVVPHGMAISSIGNNEDYVFLALGTGGDLVYQLNYSTGLLSSLQTLAPISSTTSDNAVTASPNGSYLYIARSGTNGGLAAYSIGTNGALTPLTGSPFAAGTQPYSVVVNNAGTAVYVANRGSGTISGYSIGSGGVLTALSGSPYTSGSSVTALTLDQSGNYLLAAANGGSPDLTMYSFDSVTAGKLDLSATTATGTDPVGAVAIAATH